jgi:putative hydrolase of the HAD superfamily
MPAASPAGVGAVLFDFGGVILDSPFDAFARYESERGLPEGFLRSVNAADPDANAWARLERAEVGIPEFCALFEAECRAAGHEVDGAEVLALLAGDPRPVMVDALHRIKVRGLPLALLTNNFVAGGSRPELEAIVALFDVVIESSKVGVRKPDPRFYEMACEQLGITPAEAVFLDDLGVNLKPARAMGMTTIKVGDPVEALRQLEQVLGFALVDEATVEA